MQEGSEAARAAIFDRKSLKDFVYQYLIEEIQEGHLQDGDKVNEQRISDLLQVSRTPVREALIQLGSEGVLAFEPNRGFRLRVAGPEELRELYGIVGCLDAYAASLAAGRLTKAGLADLHRLCGEMDKALDAGNYRDYYRLQLSFHNVYVACCGNTEVIQTLSRLKMRFLRQGHVEPSPERTEIYRRTNEEHHRICALFEEGDTRQLEDYLRNVHWRKDEPHIELESV